MLFLYVTFFTLIAEYYIYSSDFDERIRGYLKRCIITIEFICHILAKKN